MALHPQTTRLEVGTTVVTVPHPGEAAAVYLRFAAGAADEGPDEHGLAHLVEHMLFKGTTRHGIGGSAHAIEALGGDLNAWTSHDELVLHAVVSAGAWRLALDVLVDLVRNPLVEPEELDRERLVILEEIAGYEDDADDALSEAMAAATWPGHPYGRPVIGTRESVRAMPRDAVLGYLAHHLTPDRATVVVVADATPAEVEAEVRAAWAGWEPGPGRGLLPEPTAPRTGHLVRPEGSFDDHVVQLSWRGPPPAHPDQVPLQVLLALLGETAGDRINEALDVEPKCGFDGWAALGGGQAHTSVSVGFRALPGRSVDGIGRIRDLIARLGRSCRGRLCARARETLLADLDFAEQTVDGIAEDVLHHTLTHGDAARRLAWREALAGVTPDDVARVARTWMPVEHAVLGVVDGDASGVSLRRALKPPSTAAPKGQGQVHTRAGTRVVVRTEDSPVAAVRLVAPGGALWTPDGQAGLAEAWSRCVHRGAGRFDGEALHDALDDLATELNPVGGRAAIALSATCPAHHVADLLGLLGELVLDPHFEEAEWALVRQEMQDAIRTRLDHAHEVVEDEAAALRFAHHPWRHPIGGTLTSLGRLSGKALARFHEQHMVRGRLVVAVVGGVDEAEVDDALAWLDELPAASGRRPSDPAWPAPRAAAADVRAGTRQSVVSVLGEGAALGTRDARVYDLVETLLDGQAGRLFLELRERRGLAYDLWARHDPGHAGGLFHLGLGCDPARLDEATDGVREVLAALAEQPPDAAELARAKALVLGQETLRAQRAEHRAARLAAHLLDGVDASVDGLRTLLADIGPDDVARVVRRTLDAGFVVVRSRPR